MEIYLQRLYKHGRLLRAQLYKRRFYRCLVIEEFLKGLLIQNKKRFWMSSMCRGQGFRNLLDIKIFLSSSTYRRPSGGPLDICDILQAFLYLLCFFRLFSFNKSSGHQITCRSFLDIENLLKLFETYNIFQGYYKHGSPSKYLLNMTRIFLIGFVYIETQMFFTRRGLSFKHFLDTKIFLGFSSYRRHSRRHLDI